MNYRYSAICFAAIAKMIHAEEYPIAPQTGPSCGFFANVPALTLASGVDIAKSTLFIRSIYQLHRGDRMFERSFSKEKFYELFAILSTAHTIDHDDFPRAELQKNLIAVIEKSIDPGLAKGHAYSLRVTGIFGGAHNALLMGKKADQYVVHDPYPCKIKFLTKQQLADWMLVPTSATRYQEKRRYMTQYLEVAITHRHKAPWKHLEDLPSALKIDATTNESSQIIKALTPAQQQPKAEDINSRIAQYPQIDFAALPSEKDPKSFTNAINDTLQENELTGVIKLAKFSLSQWHLRLRDRMPVLFLDGRPHVLLGYEASSGEGKTESLLTFDNGAQQLNMTATQTLQKLKKSNCLYGTISIPCREQK